MSQDQEKRERSQLQHAAEHAKPHKKVSVMGYLAILFAAAFLLLLLSYFMQQRSSEQTISGLKDSVSAMESVQNLIENNQQLQDENDALQQQVTELQKQVTELGRDNDSLRSSVESMDDRLNKSGTAMDWFWQLDEAYVLGKYTLCRSIIQTMEDAANGDPLKAYLPSESATDNKRFSPSERYEEIYDKLY